MTREEAKKIADFVRSHIHEIITESGTDKNAHTNWVLRFVADGIETLDTEPCEDAISRDYLLSIANTDGAYGYVSAHDIAKAPSVTPKQKMGRWIEGRKEVYKCSACGNYALEWGGKLLASSYCPWCGTKMSENPTGSESEGA